MTEIYLHIVARMAEYMATHPYCSALTSSFARTAPPTSTLTVGKNTVTLFLLRSEET